MILALLIALPLPTSGTVRLPPGVTEISSELKLPDGAHDVTIIGGGHSILRAASNFHGRAILSCRGCRNIEFRNFAIDGNRDALSKPLPLPPTDKSFASFFPNNGILIEDTDGFSVDHLDFTRIASFAIIVNHSRNILLIHLSVRDSGSLNAKGRYNTRRRNRSVHRRRFGVWQHPRQRGVDAFALHVAP
jgi:hypothetical protein